MTLTLSPDLRLPLVTGRNMRITISDVRRFWAKVDTSSFDGCWTFTGSKLKDGYGCFSVNSKTVGGHRFAYAAHVMEIEPGATICHRCDNPPCCRPSHLFYGTNAENMADRHAKGRDAKGERHGFRVHPELAPRGERNGRAKLTNAQVSEIRRKATERNKTGATYRTIAKEYGVTHRVISLIARGLMWKQTVAAQPVLFLEGG